MVQAMLRIAAPVCCLLALGGVAEAKTLSMGVISRSVIETQCARAGGRVFGTADETAAYGCYGAAAIVSCTPDSDCTAVVRDTVPLTGNSLDHVLGLGREASGPSRVGPVDARTNPLIEP